MDRPALPPPITATRREMRLEAAVDAMPWLDIQHYLCAFSSQQQRALAVSGAESTDCWVPRAGEASLVDAVDEGSGHYYYLDRS